MKHIDEYINMVNNGYIPKSFDSKTRFKDGIIITDFFIMNYEQILIRLKDPVFNKEYDNAKSILQLAVNNIIKSNKITENDLLHKHIKEYIEKLKLGYKPVRHDQNQFKNGDIIEDFFMDNLEEIKKIVLSLNKNLDYKNVIYIIYSYGELYKKIDYIIKNYSKLNLKEKEDQRLKKIFLKCQSKNVSFDQISEVLDIVINKIKEKEAIKNGKSKL